MTREEFEVLRDLPAKRIVADIRFSAKKVSSPLLIAADLQITNGQGIDLRLDIQFNPETDGKTFNVKCAGVGPICRLDVDGHVHEPHGRQHKHSLQTLRCPDQNLQKDILARPELAGLSVKEVFDIFCRQAHIEHVGSFEEIELSESADAPNDT